MDGDGFPHVVRLVMGDWAHDGHGRVYEVVLRSNLDAEQVESAFGLGVGRLGGLDVTELCGQADRAGLSSAIDPTHREVLQDAGFDFGPDFVGLGPNDWAHLDPTVFASIFMFTAGLGDPSLRWEPIDPDAVLRIGGYGLLE